MRFIYVFDNQYIIKYILKFAKMGARWCLLQKIACIWAEKCQFLQHLLLSLGHPNFKTGNYIDLNPRYIFYVNVQHKAKIAWDTQIRIFFRGLFANFYAINFLTPKKWRKQEKEYNRTGRQDILDIRLYSWFRRGGAFTNKDIRYFVVGNGLFDV